MAISSQQARANALRGWSKETNRSARTLPARLASLARFEREVDPNNELPPAERAKRAEALRKAWYVELSMKGVAARQRKLMQH